MEMLITKIPDVIVLVTAAVPNVKIGEAENKIPDTSSLVTTNVPNSLNAKIAIIQKPVNSSALQITWLVSISWQLGV